MSENIDLPHAELSNAIVESRKRRREGNYFNQNHEYPFINYCFNNAFVLSEVLGERDIESRVVLGTTDSMIDELRQYLGSIEGEIENADDVCEMGYEHFWVEAEYDGETWVLNCASEVRDESFGRPLVSRSLPDSYHRFDDSVKKAAEIVTSAKENCSVCPDCGALPTTDVEYVMCVCGREFPEVSS